MIARKRSERVLLFVVLAFTCLAVVQHVQFSLIQTAPVGRDWDFHLPLSYVIQGAHFNYTKIIQWYAHDETKSVHYPPFFYIISALIAEAGLFSPLASVYLSLICWIIVLVFSVYGAGKRLGRSSWSGFAATSIAGLSFIVIHTESFDINLDFAAMATVALAVYVFYCTNDFARTGASLVLGVCCGIALLTKPVTLVYLLPFFSSGLVFPYVKRGGSRLRFGNAAICMLAALAVTCSFVLPLLPLFFTKLRFEGDLPAYRLAANARMYVWMLTYTPCTVILLMALAPGFILLKKRDRTVIPFFVSSAVSLLFFSKMHTVALGYFYPLQVWSGLLWARWMSYWSSKAKKIGSLALAITFVAPIITTLPGGEYRTPRFDRETEKCINLLKDWLAGPGSSLGENDIGYILPDNYAALAIRRGVFGSAVALARPGNPWSGLLGCGGENAALFCHNGANAEKMKRILHKKAIVMIVPEKLKENQEECMTLWNEVEAIISNTHRQEFEVPYRFYVGPGFPPQTGFTSNYMIRIFVLRDPQNTPSQS